MKKLIIATSAAALLAGCSDNLADKTIAAEAKCYGLNLEVPSTTGGQSIGKVQLGVVTTRYLSAPKGRQAAIASQYYDVNLWTLSGSVDSRISVGALPADQKPDSDRR